MVGPASASWAGDVFPDGAPLAMMMVLLHVTTGFHYPGQVCSQAQKYGI
jgi:hypothetical protein